MGPAGPAPTVSPDSSHLAAQAQQLRAWEEELSRREQELSRREQEVLRARADLAEKERLLDQKLQELGRLLGRLKDEKIGMLEASEEEIVTLSLSITEKVLQHEIENGRYKIAEVVRSTLRAVRDKGNVVIRVNPRDYELAKAAVEKLEQTFGTTRITTVPDESISLASCCIETDSGKIFSEIPGRLKRIEASLLKKNGETHGV